MDFLKNIKEDSIIYNNQIIIILKLNAMNLRKYREIYYNITNGSDNIDKILANSHFIYSIGLAYAGEGIYHGETGKLITDLSDNGTTTRDDHLGEMIVERYLVAI